MTNNENCVFSARPLIIIMAKAPAPGAVKTRLSPLLSPTQAAQVSLAFLEDTLEKCVTATRDVMLAYAPSDGDKTLREILAPALQPPSNLWFAQRGDDLSARLESVAAHGFALGFSPLIIIGADSPTLPHSILQSAIQTLADKSCDLVLGPTEDGGFYLLGLNAMQRNLYRNVAWSTPGVLAHVQTNAEKINLRVGLLQRWHDVDTPDDLRKLNRTLLQNPNAAPRTAAWLQANQTLFVP
jgi:rSAM/selenodomain-associated transferase 1